MHKFNRFTLVFLAVHFFYSCLPFEQAQAIGNIQTQQASYESEQNPRLPRSQYVGFQVQRLQKARVVWVNFEMLEELGYGPVDRMTPELEAQLLRDYGWSVNDGTSEPEIFSDEKKTMYADAYGGTGRGEGTPGGANLGSGRAAVDLNQPRRVRMQIKGVGKTPLATRTARDHSNGLASWTEGFTEAIWSELNHRELPHGANRVFLLIDRGTRRSPHGAPEADILIVRPEPIRPANFMKLTPGSPEVSREEMLKSLLENLPLNSEERQAAPGDQIHIGLGRYSKKIAEQFARAYAGLRFYHGAPTPSNIELSGRFLDYGTQTSQNGYGEIYLADYFDPAGKTEMLKKNYVEDFIAELRQLLPNLAIPSETIFSEIFARAYAEQIRYEFLFLLGYPENFVLEMVKTDEGKRLAQILERIATEGARRHRIVNPEPMSLTKFDLFSVLEVLVMSNDSENSRFQHLAELTNHEIPQETLREILNLYQSLHFSALQKAQALGLSRENFEGLVSRSYQSRSRKTPELYRKTLMDSGEVPGLEYIRTLDISKTQSYIDGLINRNTRGFQSHAPARKGRKSGATCIYVL